MDDSSIGAMMPAYNEDVAICSMVLRAHKQVDTVLIIGDGGIDRTVEVAMNLWIRLKKEFETLQKGELD